MPTTPAAVLPALRLPNWPELLGAYLTAQLAQPFAWGQNDCCLFAAGAVQAITGIDLASHLRGQYSTAAEAARILADEGGLVALASANFGAPRSNPGQAQRGDVVCVEVDGRQMLGVVAGAQWCAPGPNGLVYRPLAEVTDPGAPALVWEV